MSLFSFFLPKKELERFFIILSIEEKSIRAWLIQVSHDAVEIKGSGESELVEGKNETEAADKAISIAEKNFVNKTLAEDVFFALPISHLTGDQVKPEYLPRLKKVASELNLKPSGFIEYSEAITYFLQQKEGSPPNIILLFLAKKTVSLSLVRLGKIQQQVVIPSTSSLLTDFSEAISHFSADIFPSRILLYDESGADTAEIREALLRFPWHKHSSFIHTPKIELLTQEMLNQAVVQACAASLDLKIQTMPNLSNLPFSKEEDEKKLSHEENNLETFGFEKTQPGKKEDKKLLDENLVIPTKSPFAETDNFRLNQARASLKEKIQILFSFFNKIKFPPLTSLWKISVKPQHLISKLSLSKKFSALAALIIFSIALFSTYIFIFRNIPKATVSLFVYPYILSQNKKIVFSTDNSATSASVLTFPVTSYAEKVNGEKSAKVTGKTNIGEKALGEVVIYNKTLKSVSFSKGAPLETANLKFTLNDDITIASASDTGEGLVFGKTTVSVTATEIGPAGNISSAQSFKFENFPESSFTGKNQQAFKGGSSRQVTSVSKEDQNRLFQLLTEQLTAKAKQQISEKLKAGEQFLNGLIETSEVSQEFNIDIGQEAKEVSLKLTQKTSLYVYNQQDLLKAFQDTTSPPAGFSSENSRVTVKIENASKDKQGKINATAVISTYFLPKFNVDDLGSRILGKSFEETADILKTVSGVAGVKISTEGNLPFSKKLLPQSKHNLTIQVIPK